MSAPYFDPRRSNNFLDTCAFDPKVEPEATCAQKIRQFFEDGQIRLILSHTNQKEIEHPNTPSNVKAEALTMIYSLEVQLTPQELETRRTIYQILKGNAKVTAHYADATHIAEATKYEGCFITTDKRILAKGAELRQIGAVILKPSEWLERFSSLT